LEEGYGEARQEVSGRYGIAPAGDILSVRISSSLPAFDRKISKLIHCSQNIPRHCLLFASLVRAVEARGPFGNKPPKELVPRFVDWDFQIDRCRKANIELPTAALPVLQASSPSAACFLNSKNVDFF
jgi:hypothetical protein